MIGLCAILAIIVILFACEKSKPPVYAADKVTISKQTLDQLIKTAGDVKVERHDSIVYKDKIVIRDHNLPVPVLVSDSVRLYSDHIINSDIDITINDSVQGTLLKRSFNYIPIVKIERVEITKTIPQLITAEAPEPVPKAKLQIALIGTYQGVRSALMGAEIGFINTKNIGFHYVLQTDFNQQKFHSIKISKTFNL